MGIELRRSGQGPRGLQGEQGIPGQSGWNLVNLDGTPYTAAPGDFVIQASGDPTVVSLPESPDPGSQIGGVAVADPFKFQTTDESEIILGSGPTPFLLLDYPLANAILVYDGTNWVLASGTPNLATILSFSNDAGGATIEDLADPVNPQAAATKAYVDAAIAAALG